MSTSNCKDGASKSSGNDVCEANNMLYNMKTTDKKDNNVSVCANCGKEGDDVNNICNKCKVVKYCNAACKKKHRSKHKKDCERCVAELHDQELFKEPPSQYGDCPICFLRLPYIDSGRIYMTCCGKEICSGCFYAPVYDNQGNEVDNEKCPFCRTPTPYTDEEHVKRLKKRVEAGDAIAIHSLACTYRDGIHGSPQDHTKALELFHLAGKLGYAASYHHVGYAYHTGRGVENDNNMAKYYFELAAIEGVAMARFNLGGIEENADNWDEAIKHYLIAVTGGYTRALDQLKHLYSNGHATKEDYTKALQSYQEYLVEIKSPQRDKAAAANDRRRYY